MTPPNTVPNGRIPCRNSGAIACDHLIDPNALWVQTALEDGIMTRTEFDEIEYDWNEFYSNRDSKGWTI